MYLYWASRETLFHHFGARVLLTKHLLSMNIYMFRFVEPMAGHAHDLPDLPFPVSSTAARDPPATRASGQDDRSYTKLPNELVD